MLLDELVQVIENLALTFREWQHRAPPVVESDRGRKRQVGIPGRGGRTICEWKAKINLHVKPGATLEMPALNARRPEIYATVCLVSPVTRPCHPAAGGDRVAPERRGVQPENRADPASG